MKIYNLEDYNEILNFEHAHKIKNDKVFMQEVIKVNE